MKKLSVLIIFAIIISSLAMFNVSAVEPQWVYECNKLVVPVTADGKVDGNEWDDAVGFTANNDNPIFQQYGVWQASADRPIPSSDLSIDYKIKWDETNLYVLEVRFDKSMVVFTDDMEDDANKFPWCHSGTLFFLNYSADYANPDSDGCYEVFWVSDGTTRLVTGRNVGKAQMFEGDAEMAGVVVSTTKNGDTYTTEVIIPWATMATVSGFPAPSEGLKLRMTPIVSAYSAKTSDVADRNGETWNQLNFYTDPEVGSPDNPESNGGMILKGVNYTPPAAPEPEPEPAAPAEVAPPVVDNSPKTGDAGIILFVLALIGSGALVLRRKTAIR